MNCFNCGENGHTSKSCPLKQLYSRCTACSNVCFSAIGHKTDCGNKTFRSKFVGSQKSVVLISDFLEMEFRTVDRIVLYTEDIEIDISGDKLWFSDSSMGLQLINNKLHFSAAGEAIRTIVVIDKNNQRRMKLILSSTMVINDRYWVSAKGLFVTSRTIIKISN